MKTEINPARYVDLKEFGGSTRVGKVLCIGRNYARHAAEMRSAVPSKPMVFLKPATALVGSGGAILIPAGIGEVHHEVELVVVIGRTLKNADHAEAAAAVAGFAVGLDMTARDIQAAAKAAGGPWSIAKGYDSFAPIGPVASATGFDPSGATIRLEVNGRVVQEGHTSDMVFPVSDLLAFCSSIFTLEPGDLLYTGTPEGVGPVAPGDVLRAEVEGLPVLEISVTGSGLMSRAPA